MSKRRIRIRGQQEPPPPTLPDLSEDIPAFDRSLLKFYALNDILSVIEVDTSYQTCTSDNKVEYAGGRLIAKTSAEMHPVYYAKVSKWVSDVGNNRRANSVDQPVFQHEGHLWCFESIEREPDTYLDLTPAQADAGVAHLTATLIVNPDFWKFTRWLKE